MPDQAIEPAARERSNWLSLVEPPHLPGWRCLAGAVIRTQGEAGIVDLAALHPERGVALVGFLDEGEEGSPEEASNAFRGMLRDEGFAQRFPGELPIVALLVPRAAHGHLAAHLERSFADHPTPTVPSGWSDWLAERLMPARPTPAEPAHPRLVAPPRVEAEPERGSIEGFLVAPLKDLVPEKPPTGITLAAAALDEPAPSAGPALLISTRDEGAVEKLAPESALPAPEEPPPSSQRSSHSGWLDWGMSLGFALGVLIAVLIGLALVSRNGRLF